MRPIDADKMREDWLENGENEFVYDTNAVLESIDAQPAVDAAPVVHGHWIDKTTTAKGLSIYRFVCSACGHIFFNAGIDNFNFCPDCGARMDGAKHG
jgi:rubrerythrin